MGHRRKTCVTAYPYLVTDSQGRRVRKNHLISEKKGHIANSASPKVVRPVSGLIKQKLAILLHFLA